MLGRQHQLSIRTSLSSKMLMDETLGHGGSAAQKQSPFLSFSQPHQAVCDLIPSLELLQWLCQMVGQVTVI